MTNPASVASMWMSYLGGGLAGIVGEKWCWAVLTMPEMEEMLMTVPEKL